MRIMQKMQDDPIDRHIVEDYRKRSQKEDGQKEAQHKEVKATEPSGGDLQKAEKTLKQTGLDNALMSMNSATMDVAEVYSPPRITTKAKQMGLAAGWSLDLTTVDENGRPWDFDCVHMRNKVARKVMPDQPMILIGSPMCTEFCSWMNLNHKRMLKEVVQERPRKARVHLEFCAKLYLMQAHHGRYFLHEPPLSATSWQEPCIHNILGKHAVLHVKADQCQYGLMSRDAIGNGVVRKATGFMTNSPCIAMKLERRCPNRDG